MLTSDLRFALRSLSRSRGFALTVIVTLGLGIGANTAIFSVVRGVMLRPLPNRDGARLVYLRQSTSMPGGEDIAFSVPEINDFRESSKTLGGIAEYSPFTVTLVDNHEAERLNVGLAAPDRDEMVYLESIRYNRRVAFRNVVSGQRIPMELTSLGRAYLATLPEAQRAGLMAVFKRRRGRQWPSLQADIRAAIQQVGAQGYCAASWQPEVVAVATPLLTDDATYVLNVSLSTDEPVVQVAERVAPKLLALRGQVLDAMGRLLQQRLP